MAFLLNRTVFGTRIYAIGSNEQAAYMAGVPVKLIRVALFMLSGGFAALAGVLLLGYSGTSFANVGEQYMLASIIAVVLGGDDSALDALAVAADAGAADASRTATRIGTVYSRTGQPDKRRDTHLPSIKEPMLFIQGSSDTFGNEAEMQALVDGALRAPER